MDFYRLDVLRRCLAGAARSIFVYAEFSHCLHAYLVRVLRTWSSPTKISYQGTAQTLFVPANIRLLRCNIYPHVFCVVLG